MTLSCCKKFVCIAQRNNRNVEMPNEDSKMLKYNHGEKSLKAPFFLDFDT